MNVTRDDEEASQTSSMDTLMEKPFVRWRDNRDGEVSATGFRGSRLSTALILHTLLVAALGGAWLLLSTVYGYEYEYGPNLIKSKKAYPLLSLTTAA